MKKRTKFLKLFWGQGCLSLTPLSYHLVVLLLVTSIDRQLYNSDHNAKSFYQYFSFLINTSQQKFTYSRSTIETLEKSNSSGFIVNSEYLFLNFPVFLSFDTCSVFYPIRAIFDSLPPPNM